MLYKLAMEKFSRLRDDSVPMSRFAKAGAQPVMRGMCSFGTRDMGAKLDVGVESCSEVIREDAKYVSRHAGSVCERIGPGKCRPLEGVVVQG